MSDSLIPIKFPNLTESEFGSSLAQQFANINTNFQKLANFGLYSGEDGKSCSYITYNLNAVFFYATSETGDVTEVDDAAYHEEFLRDAQEERPVLMRELEQQVEADYQEFYRLTKGTKKEYAQMCSFLLWGSKVTFMPANTPVSRKSMMGVLAHEYEGVLGDIDITDRNRSLNYKALWLKDWFEIGEYKTAEQKAAKLKIFLDHMDEFDPGKIIVAVSPTNNPRRYAVGDYEPVGSLAYVYIDPRFRNEHMTAIQQGISQNTKDMWATAEDISCVLYWTMYEQAGQMIGTFKCVNAFPQIWSDGTGFFWKINNKKTNIPVSGTQGLPGKNSQFLVVQRVENLSHIDRNSIANARIWAPLGGNQYVVRTADSGRPFRTRRTHAELASLFEMDLSAEVRDSLKASPITNNSIQKYQFNLGEAIPFGEANINAGGWLYDTTGFNETQLNQLYRVYRIVGQESFWKVIDTTTHQPVLSDNDTYAAAFRPDDPTYEYSNYTVKGKSYKVVVNNDPEIQNRILELDGAPCIVVPGPSYNLDRTDSTVWFGTLKATRAYADQPDLMLVVYCGDENQMTTDLDEHTQAGNMQELDVYTSKKTGDNRNKPRGQMLPIGSAHLSAFTDPSVQRDPGDVFGSHFIHSDLGGFASRGTETYTDHKGIVRSRYYGVQPQAPTGKVLSSTGSSILYNNLPQLGSVEFPKDGQFANIPYKRIMHVGSVNDYRTLNFVPVGADGSAGASGNKTPNGAVPGRKGAHTNVQDYAPYGTPDFWGNDVLLYGAGKNEWFAGSEIHIDEPLTITRYRDLHKRKHLLTVEGDTLIGPHIHTNAPGVQHFFRDGGLFIQSTLSKEISDNDVIWNNSIFKRIIGEGVDMRFLPFLRVNEIREPSYMGPVDNTNWVRRLARSNARNPRFVNNYLGRWDYSQDGMYAGEATWPNSYRAYPSILAEDLIGGRILMGLDGIAVVNQTALTHSTNNVEEGDPVIVPFSVDRRGNIQTSGAEVRSNSKDTLWAFHTAWRTYDKEFTVPPTNQCRIKSPVHNQTVFGTSHLFQQMIGTNTESPRAIIPYQLANHPDYTLIWTSDTDHRPLVKNGGYVTWRTLDQEPVGLLTDFGYINNGRYAVAFDHTNDTLTNLGGSGSDIIPSILKLWDDLLYQKGSLTVQGVAFMPVMLEYHGDKNRNNPIYAARFGINAGFGMVIGLGGARAATGGDEVIGQPLDVYNQLRNDLESPFGNYDYEENEYLTDVQKHLGRSTFGDVGEHTDIWKEAGDYNIFYNHLGAHLHPGLWVRSGALINESVFIGRDLVVDRMAAIKGQIRAKSFRRITNSEHSTDPESNGSAWAFMLDNGMSSTSAPHHKSVTGTFFDRNKQSPIIFDLGSAYGPSRLIRFGVARTAKLPNPDGKQLKLDLDYDDRNVILFGAQPGESYEYYNVVTHLFGTNTNKITINAQSNNLWASISICIELDRCFTSRDKNKKGPFGGGRYSKCWGIGTPSYPGGTSNNTATNDDPNNSVELICSGFVWSHIFKNGFPKPKFNVDQWLGSVFGGPGVRDDCNWDVKGTDSARDKQFGVLFRITPSGQLVMPMYYAPGAICSTPGKSVTLTFTYPVAAPGFNTKFMAARSTGINDGQPSGIEIFNSSNPIIDDLKVVESTPGWASPSMTWKYYWFKCYNGYTAPTESDFDNIDWQLWKTYSRESVEYYRSKDRTRPDESDNPSDAGNSAEPINEQKISPQTIGGKQYYPYPTTSGKSYTWDEFVTAVDEGDEAILNDIATTEYPCLWKKITSSTGNETSSVWDLVWELTDDATNNVGARVYTKDIILNFYANMFKNNSGEHEQFWRKTFDAVSVKATAVVTKEMVVMDLVVPLLGDGNERTGGWKYFPGIPHAWNCAPFDRYAWAEYGTLGVGRNLLAKQNKPAGVTANPGPNHKTYNYDSSQKTPKNLHEIFDLLVDGKEEWVKPHAPQQIFIPAMKSGGGDIAGDDNEQQYGIWLGLADNENADLVVVCAKRPVMSNGEAAKGTTVEWYRQKVALRFSWMKASANQPQVFKQATYYKFSLTKPSSTDYGTKLEEGQQLPEVSEGQPKLWVRYETAPSVFGEWFLYAEWSDDEPSDPEPEETNTDLTWKSTTDPTTSTLNNWLNESRCAKLKNDILGLGVGQSTTLTTQFGSATLVCPSQNKAVVSAIVTSYNTSANDLSHRSINFEYNTSTKRVSKLSGTYIIQKTFNPGYYYASTASGDNASFIGTTNTGTVSDDPNRKYVLYTNDGKAWSVVDMYVAPDPNRYYFACASASANNENTYDRYPGGFLAFANTSPTDLVLFTGASNYLPMTHGLDDPNTTLDEMKVKVQTLVTKCINAGAKPGVVPKCNGLVQIWSFAKSDKNSIDRTKLRIDKSTGSTGLRVQDIYKGPIDIRHGHVGLTRWADNSDNLWKTGVTAFGPNIKGNWDTFAGWSTYDAVRLFICLTFSERLSTGCSWDQEFTDRRNTVYSDNVGFAPGWYETHIWNEDFFPIEGAWESYHVAPTTESGPGSTVSLKWGGPFQMTISRLQVNGMLRADLTGYDWPVGTGELVGDQFPAAGSGFNKLCAIFNIDNVGAAWQGWIPYAKNLEVDILVTDLTTGKRKNVKCYGGPEKFKVTDLDVEDETSTPDEGEDVTKLTTVDVALNTPNRDGETFKSHFQGILNALVGEGILTKSLLNTRKRYTVVGPGGTFTIRFRNEAQVDMNGTIWTNIRLANGDWCGAQMFFGAAMKVDPSSTLYGGTTIVLTDYISLYYSETSASSLKFVYKGGVAQ